MWKNKKNSGHFWITRYNVQTVLPQPAAAARLPQPPPPLLLFGVGGAAGGGGGGVPGRAGGAGIKDQEEDGFGRRALLPGDTLRSE